MFKWNGTWHDSGLPLTEKYRNWSVRSDLESSNNTCSNPQNVKFPFRLKSQQPSEKLRGALALIHTEKQRKMVSGDRFEITVGHEEHSLVLIVQQGPTCSILTSLLCVSQLFLTSKKINFFHFSESTFSAPTVKLKPLQNTFYYNCYVNTMCQF